MIGENSYGVDYEDALVQAIRIFAARGRAIREAREKENQGGTDRAAETTGDLLAGILSTECPLLLDEISPATCEDSRREISV